MDLESDLESDLEILWKQFNDEYILLVELFKQFTLLFPEIYNTDFCSIYIKYKDIKEIYNECKLIFKYENSPGNYNIIFKLVKPIFEKLEFLYSLTKQINSIHPFHPFFKVFNFILPTDADYYKSAYLTKNLINKQTYIELIDLPIVINFLGLI